MALVHPRGMALLVPREAPPLNVTSSFNNTIENTSPAQPIPLTNETKTSWVDKIPGIKWLKNKIGRTLNPTYGMTDEEVREWTREEWKKERLSRLRRKRLVEFKAAKYMALYHPDYYWYKYIFPLEEGSEKRKRAVFLFILVNKEEWGSYYGRLLQPTLVDEELAEMGINPRTQNIIGEYLSEAQNIETVTDSTAAVEMRKRSIFSEFTTQLSEVNKRLLLEMKREVDGLDVSQLKVESRKRYAPNSLGVREYAVRDEDV